jgi:hypothetical protein
MENYRNYTDEQLQDTQVILLEDMASIRYQLEAAKSNAAMDGEYADADWFRKATYALRMKGAQQQAISIEVGRRKRMTQSRLETWFVRIAREILEEDLFDEIMDEAKDKVRSNSPDPSAE